MEVLTSRTYRMALKYPLILKIQCLNTYPFTPQDKQIQHTDL